MYKSNDFIELHPQNNLPMSVTCDVIKFDIFNDTSNLQYENMEFIVSTFDVSKWNKFKEVKE